MTRPIRQPGDRPAGILARACVRAARHLGLSQRRLAAVLGISEASASRLTRGRGIDPSSKEGELALLFVRLYRSLDALVGGDDRAARAWIHAHNHHLAAVPGERIATVSGLVGTVQYLDALRARN